ncbi:hypothetical protein T492DRAFT_842799 [Pavlovales sp. CCMP2436]|nr:hypothetical protein T492DRAFT_842799 [Pavlovales sp. CCMP2436]
MHSDDSSEDFSALPSSYFAPNSAKSSGREHRRQVRAARVTGARGAAYARVVDAAKARSRWQRFCKPWNALTVERSGQCRPLASNQNLSSNPLGPRGAKCTYCATHAWPGLVGGRQPPLVARSQTDLSPPAHVRLGAARNYADGTRPVLVGGGQLPPELVARWQVKSSVQALLRSDAAQLDAHARPDFVGGRQPLPITRSQVQSSSAPAHARLGTARNYADGTRPVLVGGGQHELVARCQVKTSVQALLRSDAVQLDAHAWPDFVGGRQPLPITRSQVQSLGAARGNAVVQSAADTRCLRRRRHPRVAHAKARTTGKFATDSRQQTESCWGVRSQGVQYTIRARERTHDPL